MRPDYPDTSFINFSRFTLSMNAHGKDLRRYTSPMHSDNQHHVLEFSPFLQQLINRHPQWLDELQTDRRLNNTSPPSMDQITTGIEKHGLNPALRQFRNKEMMRLIWRDLHELAPVDEILADLSCLADLCLTASADYHTRLLEKTHGTPRNADGLAQRLVIIGLGKLGGCELNLSSDIDIVFCYPEQGVCDGRRGLSNEQFFTRLARHVIRSLSEVTADGFCYRVDTRLRPFGDSGPLVSSFAALEQYYQREGRDWERYALLKARPVVCEKDCGQSLLNILRPFVYRRYIDYGAVEALREMHANVREDALRKNRLDDVKRGPGGIREIEFLVQTFQLLRGGQEPVLQTPSLFSAATAIKKLQLLPEETVESLMAAYRFLRKTENRIQALHDQQTHRVPTGADGLRVARAMGFDEVVHFQAALNKTRRRVQDLFAQSLPGPKETAVNTNPWHACWQGIRHNTRDEYRDVSGWKPLAAFVKRLNRLSLSQRASHRLDQFMPALLELFDTMAPDDDTVGRVLDLVSSICRRSAYLSLLVQNPEASKRMLELFTASKRVAQTVTRYPALLDELIDPSLGACPPTLEDINSGVQDISRAHNDTETIIQRLNYFKHVISLRIAVAVLKSTMSTTEASMALSQLAQSLVAVALDLARIEMENRHGHLPGPGLAVIAYGSLGAHALGFDSDLDLVFLYQSIKARSDGPRAIQAERYHTGVARRMLGLLSAITPGGRLYHIDARLRPNGRSGLLVSTVDAFERYQSEQAWVWELQALTRARPIAGSDEIADRFIRIRQAVLTAPRDLHLVKRELLSMRERLRAQHKSDTPLKQDPGGTVDIEFVVQLGLLLNAEKYPEITHSTDIDRQLQALRDCGWLSVNTYKTLGHAYTQLVHARQMKALIDKQKEVENVTLLDIAYPLCDQILR